MKNETKTIKVRVGRADAESWAAEAKKANLTVSEWLRRRVSLRPLTARKRKYDELATERTAQDSSSPVLSSPEDGVSTPDDDEDDPVLAREEAEWQARLESERRELRVQQRRWRANGLAYAAGGARRWYASMTPEHQAEWDDLKEAMLRSER